MHHTVFSYKNKAKLMFPLCSACANTMNRGECTHFDDERCTVGICEVDKFCKAVEMGYCLMDVYEF